MNLRSIMVNSENPDQLVEFYTKILGKPTWEMAPFTGWMIGDGGLMIGPHSEVKGKNTSPGRLMFVFETKDVQGDFDRMKGQGAEVISAPEHPGGAPDAEDVMLACLADPDGNYFQLTTPFDPAMMQDK